MSFECSDFLFFVVFCFFEVVVLGDVFIVFFGEVFSEFLENGFVV